MKTEHTMKSLSDAEFYTRHDGQGVNGAVIKRAAEVEGRLKSSLMRYSLEERLKKSRTKCQSAIEYNHLLRDEAWRICDIYGIYILDLGAFIVCDAVREFGLSDFKKSKALDHAIKSIVEQQYIYEFFNGPRTAERRVVEKVENVVQGVCHVMIGDLLEASANADESQCQKAFNKVLAEVISNASLDESEVDGFVDAVNQLMASGLKDNAAVLTILTILTEAYTRQAAAQEG